jgi:type II secretory pathway component PulM
MRKSRFFLGGGLLILLLSTPHTGLTQPSSDELKQLREDIRSIKEGQKAISNDLQEIKKLLAGSGRGGEDRSPVRDINTVLNIGDIPFKGDKQAALTLVEFTDYQ